VRLVSHQSNNVDVLVVGAGFAGSVVARQLAEAGHRVQILEKRSHIGGNAWDVKDDQGILIHPYGPHIFHTNSEKVLRFLSRFTDWRFYEHRVLARVNDKLVPLPINRTTINQLYDLNLKEDGVAEFLNNIKEPIAAIKTSEDVVLSSVGKDLCDLFFRGYTKKQWGLDLSELSAGVAARIPTRTNDDDRYFTDQYQFMPLDGYGAMFKRILEHPLISIRCDVDYFEIRNSLDVKHTVYTGSIDAFFSHEYGKLPYRSLSFEHSHILDCDSYQPVGTVNYPNQHAYTRITEFKKLTGQKVSGTSIVKEYPQAEGDPFYPIPRPENDAIYKKYQTRAEQESNVTFVGRLAEYRYYNMDQVVASALSKADKIIEKLSSD
jgi:UDP-galactopyranose mutase